MSATSDSSLQVIHSTFVALPTRDELFPEDVQETWRRLSAASNTEQYLFLD
jgi:hypothetical protein